MVLVKLQAYQSKLAIQKLGAKFGKADCFILSGCVIDAGIVETLWKRLVGQISKNISFISTEVFKISVTYFHQLHLENELGSNREAKLAKIIQKNF